MGQTPTSNRRFSRRQFIGSLTAALALGAGYYFGVHRHLLGDYTLKSSKTMMGTIVNFTIIGPDEQSCRHALQATVVHMEKKGRPINWYDPESQLSRLNREGVLEEADPTLLEVVRMSLEMSRITEGAFDPTVLPLLGLYKNVRQGGALPTAEKVRGALARVGYQHVVIEGNSIRYAKPGMGMTLDGLGKGYIVDEGVRKINALGFPNVCIEAGGDLMVTGSKGSGKPWTIAIRNPRPDRSEEQIFLKMKDRAIATSGDYMQPFSPDRRYHHIINPHTGFSPPELASCSILAPTVARADGLATSAMVMGPEKSIALLDSLADCEGFLIGKDLTTYSSKDFFKYNENV